MSNIPNSAIPHAAPKEPDGDDQGAVAGAVEQAETVARDASARLGKASRAAADTIEDAAGKAQSTVKANPRTAIAVGAAVIAGAAVAAAGPLLRAFRKVTGDTPAAKPAGKTPGRGKAAAKTAPAKPATPRKPGKTATAGKAAASARSATPADTATAATPKPRKPRAAKTDTARKAAAPRAKKTPSAAEETKKD